MPASFSKIMVGTQRNWGANFFLWIKCRLVLSAEHRAIIENGIWDSACKGLHDNVIRYYNEETGCWYSHTDMKMTFFLSKLKFLSGKTLKAMFDLTFSPCRGFKRRTDTHTLQTRRSVSKLTTLTIWKRDKHSFFLPISWYHRPKKQKS